MIFSLDVLRARKGDCLLLHFGPAEDPGLALVDGGPDQVYRLHLRDRLAAIRKARGLGEQESLLVDLLMVSHVDDDHIQGILDLTKEEIVAREAHRPRLLNVQSFWHNSFGAIIGHRPDELTAAMTKRFGAAAVAGGGLDDDAVSEIAEALSEDWEVVGAALKVLASMAQGFRLRDAAERLGYPLNPEVDGTLIMAQAGAQPVEIGKGLTLTVVGPMQPELLALSRKHQEWLKDLKEKGLSPEDALAAYVDKSIPNLSSIVVLAECDGKRILLTGDARGDKIIEGLQLVGLLDPGDDSAITVDILKVPHHGSARNLEEGFFRRFVARHYVFSGDGEHGNPEREALEMLAAARGDADYEIHFTYPQDEIDVARAADWTKERNKQLARRKKNPTVAVQEEWSPEKHGLEAFFADHPKMAKRLRIVEPGKPHLIDLLDPAAV